MKRENYYMSPALLKLHKRDWSSLNLETQNKVSETEASQFIQPNL